MKGVGLSGLGFKGFRGCGDFRLSGCEFGVLVFRDLQIYGIFLLVSN